MLYDNALLIELMRFGWRHTALYAQRIAQTIAWAMAEMRVDAAEGGLFAFATARSMQTAKASRA